MLITFFPLFQKHLLGCNWPAEAHETVGMLKFVAERKIHDFADNHRFWISFSLIETGKDRKKTTLNSFFEGFGPFFFHVNQFVCVLAKFDNNNFANSNRNYTRISRK